MISFMSTWRKAGAALPATRYRDTRGERMPPPTTTAPAPGAATDAPRPPGQAAMTPGPAGPRRGRRRAGSRRGRGRAESRRGRGRAGGGVPAARLHTIALATLLGLSLA